MEDEGVKLSELIGDTEDQEREDNFPSFDFDCLGEYEENVLFYMAGWASRTVSSSIKCLECKESLFNTEMNNDLNTQLFNIKQKGGLLTPSRSVVKVIKTSHMLLKRILSNSQEIVYKPPKNFLLNRLINDIVHECTPSVFPELREHELDCSPLEPHSPSLIKLIAKKFCTALLCHFCDRLSQETIGCSRLKRNQSSQLSIFKKYL